MRVDLACYLLLMWMVVLHCEVNLVSRIQVATVHSQRSSSGNWPFHQGSYKNKKINNKNEYEKATAGSVAIECGHNNRGEYASVTSEKGVCVCVLTN